MHPVLLFQLLLFIPLGTDTDPIEIALLLTSRKVRLVSLTSQIDA